MSISNTNQKVELLAAVQQGGGQMGSTGTSGGAQSVHNAIGALISDAQSIVTSVLILCFIIACVYGGFQFKNGGNWANAFGGAGIILVLAIATGIGPQAVEWFTSIGENAG